LGKGRSFVYAGEFYGRGKVEPVAVKQLTIDKRDMAHSESDLLKIGEKCPNVVRILALCEKEADVWLVLERCERTLAQLMSDARTTMTADGRPTLPCMKVAHGMCVGLKDLHALRIVHRDLKPSNVLLTAEGVPKLADMGLSKLLPCDKSTFGTGQPRGTEGWQAPEQMRQSQQGACVYVIAGVRMYVCAYVCVCVRVCACVCVCSIN
jgi:serine/threonine-protein kinase/endoribonuclease IRE1